MFTAFLENRNRRFNPLAPGIGILILLFLLPPIAISCSGQGKFVRLPETKAGEGTLMLLRPVTGVQILQSFTVSIFRYPGHFTDGKEYIIDTLDLYENEYAVKYLEPGFYLVKLTDFENTFTVIHIKAEERLYLSVRPFGGGIFSRADAILEHLEPPIAVGHLIEETGMDRNERSEDPYFESP